MISEKVYRDYYKIIKKHKEESMMMQNYLEYASIRDVERDFFLKEIVEVSYELYTLIRSSTITGQTKYVYNLDGWVHFDNEKFNTSIQQLLPTRVLRDIKFYQMEIE